MAQEAPYLNYKVTRPIMVAVVDERDVLTEGKPPTFIGRADGAFGIPSDMEAYPWFVSDKAKKGQTLAQALEERIVMGLNDEGWQLTAAAMTKPPTRDETVSLLAAHSAQRWLVLSLTKWHVSINLNWVTAFNCDWGYRLEVYDQQGKRCRERRRLRKGRGGYEGGRFRPEPGQDGLSRTPDQDSRASRSAGGAGTVSTLTRPNAGIPATY